jgi:hypothetical protein
LYRKEEVILNIGGRKYQVFRKTISSFPGTRLGRLARSDN